MGEKTEKETVSGTVYLIGAGPGDEGLLTVKGRRLIEEADVIIYDHLANPALLNYAKKDARRSMPESRTVIIPCPRKRSMSCWLRKPDSIKRWSG